MMRKVVKQVAGIDVAQKELVVTLGRMLDDFSTISLTCSSVVMGFQFFIFYIFF